MAGEASLWQYVKKHLTSKVRYLVRVENSAGSPGLPDIFCVLPSGNHCWIELKRNKYRPHVTTKHTMGLSPAQLLWHRQYVRDVGSSSAFVLWQYNKKYLLFRSEDIVPLLTASGLTTRQIESNCLKIWLNKIDWEDFVDVLEKP